MSIQVVGLGLDPDALPESHARVIREAAVLVGGKRQLDYFKDHPARKVAVTSPVAQVIAQVAELDQAGEAVVVLADGDPLFFGMGNTLVRELGADRVRVLPNVSTVQAAAARLGIPLHLVRAVSLHGRDDFQPLLAALMRESWVAVLTDDTHDPPALANILLDRLGEQGAVHLAMWVLEDLGAESERVGRHTLAQARGGSFSRLNVVLFERLHAPKHPLHLGLSDDLFAKEKNLITKWPVRAAGLAALSIEPGNTVWDLGAGCGAVAVEASALAHQGRVYAVEQRAERVAMIRDNVARFGALLVEVVHGAMPGALTGLPDPDRVFVGGGLGRNPEILDAACARLAPGGRIVVHCVLLATLERARRTFEKLGWPHGITQVQASHSAPVAGDVRFKAENPVFIVDAQKPEQA